MVTHTQKTKTTKEVFFFDKVVLHAVQNSISWKNVRYILYIDFFFFSFTENKEFIEEDAQDVDSDFVHLSLVTTLFLGLVLPSVSETHRNVT